MPLYVLPSIVLVSALALVGFYQAITGRPSMINFDRIVRRRTPATNLDCVLYGVGNLLLAAALAVWWAPSLSHMVFTGGTPQSVFWSAVVFFWPSGLMVIFISAWATVARRIKYTSLEPRVSAS